MKSDVDSLPSTLAQSSMWGTARGLAVESIVYPLEVMKIRQQCAKESKTSIEVARQLFRQEGAFAFYRGLSPQLLKTSLRQVWCWPMIIGVPKALQPYGVGQMQQQILTGLSIATVDAAVTAPLERQKIFSALTRREPFSLNSICKEGWQGAGSYWMKRSFNMISFLAAQKYFRDQGRKGEKELSFWQMTKVGTQTALVVSIASAPFDLANTLKQSQNCNLFELFSRQKISRLYRGSPMNALSLLIHNIASIIIIEKLS